MSTLSHQPTGLTQPTRSWTSLLTGELWASLAISMMWVAVLFTSVFGPDFVSTNGSGTQSTTIPSGILVAFFAFLGTASVAKHALRPDKP